MWAAQAAQAAQALIFSCAYFVASS